MQKAQLALIKAAGNFRFTPVMDSYCRLESCLRESGLAIGELVRRGLDHWLLTFSGGKDSTTTVILALETALRAELPVDRIDVVYCDTLVEIPVIQRFALNFLDFLAGLDRIRSLPLYFHIVRPELNERFWVCLLGKGYPPPHQRFRWCTKRLKIKPVEAHLRSVMRPNRTVIITGVRYGESSERDRRMYEACRRGGECGQGIWLQHSQRLQVSYLAPIAYWKACDVWDFLNFYALQWGYPTNVLESEVYNGRETRFGCWVCTVVKQDKAMERITARPEWAHLRPLMEFRERVLKLASLPESRYPRPNGAVGRLSLHARQSLLDELLRLQEHMKMLLISEEEVQMIKALWEDPRYREYGEVNRNGPTKRPGRAARTRRS